MLPWLSWQRLQKPILLVFNKIDLYKTDERDALLGILKKRVDGLIADKHIVQTIADPRKIEYVIEQAGGSSKSEWRKPEPDVRGSEDSHSRDAGKRGARPVGTQRSDVCRLTKVIGFQPFELKCGIARLIRSFGLWQAPRRLWWHSIRCPWSM